MVPSSEVNVTLEELQPIRESVLYHSSSSLSWLYNRSWHCFFDTGHKRDVSLTTDGKVPAEKEQKRIALRKLVSLVLQPTDLRNIMAVQNSL